MNTDFPVKKPSLPVVPISFIALVIVGALLFWWLRPPVGPGPDGPVGVSRLEPFRIEGGILHTNGDAAR